MIKRYDPTEPGYIGSGEYVSDMAEDNQGDYVLHADHIEVVRGLVEVLRKACAAMDGYRCLAGYGCLSNRPKIEREMLDAIAKATGEKE